MIDSKTKIASLIAVVIVFSLSVATTLPTSSSATADNFGVEDASGYKNTNVLVPVNITNVHSEPIAGIEFELLYDSSVINLTEIQKGALTSQWSAPDKYGTEGDYVIGIVGAIPNALTNGSTGSVVVLNFSITGEPGETSPMNLTNIKLVNASGDETGTAPASNGTFTIIGGPTPTLVFDTRSGTYPSISGTHNGTIKPNQTITVHKMYTYPCPGTGGHSEYVKIYYNESAETIAEGNWTGYGCDWHNISFDKPFILKANETYTYTIKTGSYPQIIHAHTANVTGGTITCNEFLDANRKRHDDWIPAIKFF